MEVIDQDELFFADLNKQISLLIMDDDDDDDADHLPSPPVMTYQAYSGVVQPITQVFKYEQSKGTGVFIPPSTHRRRKSKQERLNTNTNYNAAATSDNTSESLNNSKGIHLPQRQHQLSCNIYTSYSSLNHKRI